MIKQLHTGTPMPEPTDIRPLMFSIAYRMLGRVAEAEDVVQEAYLRLQHTMDEGVAIESPKAFLATVTTRLAIDHLRSARVLCRVVVARACDRGQGTCGCAANGVG